MLCTGSSTTRADALSPDDRRKLREEFEPDFKDYPAMWAHIGRTGDNSMLSHFQKDRRRATDEASKAKRKEQRRARKK